MKGILIIFTCFTVVSIIFDEAWSLERKAAYYEVFLDENDSLNDGWYIAKVTYSNHKKIPKKTSDLKVEVQDNKVIKINLGNGKILESDEKESEYIYSGGVLNFKYNFKTKAKIAKTSVKIKEVNGNLSFYDISII